MSWVGKILSGRVDPHCPELDANWWIDWRWQDCFRCLQPVPQILFYAVSLYLCFCLCIYLFLARICTNSCIYPVSTIPPSHTSSFIDL